MNNEFPGMPSPTPRPLPSASIARDLSRLRRLGRADGLTLHQVVQSLADRSTPLLLLFLGLLGLVPSPGLPLGMITGTLVISVAIGMLLRPRQPMIPRSLGRRRLSPDLLNRFMAFAIPFVRRLERKFRPRLSWLVSGAGLVVAAAVIIVQGIGLALPLPFGNLPFAFGIVLIALGLLTGDGLGALAGHVIGLASTAGFVLLGVGAVNAGGSLAAILPW
jgi:hypothetical protein